MMKIGILTFHCAHNYGAVLQCYATQEFLVSKGYEVEVINYRPECLIAPYKIFDINRILSKSLVKTLKSLLIELLVFYSRVRRFIGFEKFIETRLNVGKEITPSTLPADYDIYIVGSDQIWNPKITGGFDPVYFCDFPFSKGRKKYIAYAASMESTGLTQVQKDFFKQNFKKFDAIGVREKDLLEQLQSLVPNRMNHVLDPTLMVPTNVWDNISSYKRESPKRVVVYQVRTNSNTMRIANHIAHQIGAKVYVLVASLQPIPSNRVNQTATPEEFVDVIRNAACVVTTSFHGTAFSIIHNVAFYTIKLNDGADSRSSSLLTSLELSDRIIEADELPNFTEVNYIEVNKKLDILRERSQDFLLTNIQNAIS